MVPKIVVCVHVLVVFCVLLDPDHGGVRGQLRAVQLDRKRFMRDKVVVLLFLLVFNRCLLVKAERLLDLWRRHFLDSAS